MRFCGFYKPKMDSIEEIYNHFKGKFPGVNDDVLRERIENGCRNREGSLFRLYTIDAWEKVFSFNRCYTVFQSWDEYFKYDGDPRKHPNYSETALV